MKIGRFEIEGVSPRFYVIVGVLVLIVILFFTFRPGGSDTDKTELPAWPQEEMAQKAKDPNYLQAEIDAYGLQSPAGIDSLYNLAEFSGIPFRANVYIPNLEDNKELRPELDKANTNGWRFLPAMLIPSDEVLSKEDLVGLYSDNSTTEAFMVGFPSGKAPAPGNAYEIIAQLWWRSDRLFPEDVDPAVGGSPVAMAISATPLTDAELRAPTTQRANMNLTYQQGSYQMSLSTIDWSANNELRACVTISNTSNRQVPVWPGVQDGVVAITPSGTSPGAVEENSSFTTTEALAGKQSLSGYITFPAEAANPDQPLEIIFPGLRPDASEDIPDKLSVKVPAKLIKSINDDKEESRGCGIAQVKPTVPESSTPEDYSATP